MTANILLVGCGKMGGAMLQRLPQDSKILVVDPAPAPATLTMLANIKWLERPELVDAEFQPDIVIIAVKPQHMATVLPAYAHYRKSVFLSIAAGQTIEKLTSLLGGDNCAIVRAMPNLPASVGQGMTVAVANQHVFSKQRTLCERCLKAIGEVTWAENEGWLDAVTAVSGSGPAYVFALVEAMARAGEALGLPPQLASQLARQTAIGSGALLAQSPESATGLRVAVTSPGGTTEAALKVLSTNNVFSDLMLKAIQAAAQRAKELS